MGIGKPQPGFRVKAVTKGWENSDVYHALYLPRDWKSAVRFPVIVEYPGNGGYRNKYGDTCNGTLEGCSLGFGIGGGLRFIWVCLPFVSKTPKGGEVSLKWWGDVEETKRYCTATVREVCQDWNGNTQQVFLAGFSRGAIAANYIGLHDDAIASLWCGFVCHSHYDGVRRWGYADDDADSALARLRRLKGRPQWISQEASVNSTKDYLQATGIPGSFTFVPLPFRNHSDQWVLRDLPERRTLRDWVNRCLQP
jgi:hypothetical protein